MTDIIDRANDEAQRWLDSQIAKTHHNATDDLSVSTVTNLSAKSANKQYRGQYAVSNAKLP